MFLKQPHSEHTTEQGFSILELLIAMSLSLIALVAATTLLASSLHIQNRENLRTSAMGSTQRALNSMSREIANAGYGLADNGIVVNDSSSTSIRVRSNLNNNNSLSETDEDVRFIFQSAKGLIVRFDNSPSPNGTSTILASNIRSLTITYRDSSGTAITSASNYVNAETISLDIQVDLPAGPDEPAGTVRLVSDVTLRNAPNAIKRF